MAVSPLPELSGKLAIDVVRRLRAIDSEFSTLYATNGTLNTVTITNLTIGDTLTLGNATILEDDLYSNNWVSGGGTVPLNLPDATATTGFALDGFAGEAQFQSIYADGGTLGTLTVDGDLTLNGGKFATAASGQRVEITDGDRIRYYTGLVSETNYGYILADNSDASNPSITIQAPTSAGTGHSYQFKSNGLYIKANTGSTDVYIEKGSTDVYVGVGGSAASPIVLMYDKSGGSNGEGLLVQNASGTDLFRVENNSVGGAYARFDVPTTVDDDLKVMNGVFEAPDGSFSATAYGFTNDAAMGVYKEGTDILGLASGTGGKGLSLGDGYLKIHRKNSDTTEGGELQFEGGTSYANSMYIDRHQNNLRMVYNAAEKIRIASDGDITTLGALRAGAVGGTLTNGYVYAIPGTTGTASNATWILATGSTYYLARQTSRRKYKKQIDYQFGLADVDLPTAKFWRDDDERWFYGFIYEDLEEQSELLVDGKEMPDTTAIIAVLADKVKRLEREAEEWKKLRVGECRCSCRST